MMYQKIKNRPPVSEADEAKVVTKYNDYCISETTDACYVFIAIENVASKNYRNWKRDITKTVLYEILYRYMELHQVILNKEGIKTLISRIKQKSPSFEEPDKLFTKQDGFLIQMKK